MPSARNSQPLMELIVAVRRRARRLLVLHAICWLAAAVAAGVLLLGVVDYVLRIDDAGVRWFCSLALAVLGVLAVVRFLLPAFRRRLGDVELARRIEKRYPTLGERLSSAVEFMGQSDDQAYAGSPLLRRAVIIDATQAAAQVKVNDIVDARPTRKAILPALTILLAAVIVICIAPRSSQIAVSHLLLPWQDHPWPRQHQLAVENTPSRVARGQSFEARVVDRNGELPDEVRMHFRFVNADGTTSEEVERMQPLAGAMVARRDQVARAFEYRAEGGDDRSMPWTAVEVIDPPGVKSLAITLHPPKYSGLEVETSPRKIVALAGTQIDVNGRSTKPLTSATLKQDGLPDVACMLSADKTSFSLSGDQWTATKSGKYWFALRDAEDLVGGEDDRWEFQALPDTPPIVTIEQPSGALMMTPTAIVPLRIVASDNLALRTVELVYLRSDQSDKGEISVPLYSGPQEPVARAGGLAAVGDGERQVIEHRWSLAELNLPPGTRLAFHASAADYKPQMAVSEQRLITIISQEDLRQRLAGKQAFILGELRRILKMQTDARTQVSSLVGQFRDVGRIRRQDVSQLQGTGLNQRQVARSLASPGEGILTQIDAALEELRNNQVDSPTVERQLQALRDAIKRISTEELPPLESALTAAQKSAETAVAASKEAAGEKDAGVPTDERSLKSLDTAAAGQDRVIAALEQLLDGYAQWINYREFAGDVSQIRHELGELQNDTRTVGAGTLTKDFRELTPQQQTDLRQLAVRQTELQRRFDKTQQQLDRAAQQLAESDPLAAQTLTDALHAARQSGISGQMSTGSRQLEGNQIGQALESQKNADAALAEMLDILSGKREHELSHLASKLRAAEQQLEQLRGQQQSLVGRQRAAQQMADAEQKRAELKRLSAAQKKLQEEIERFARQLKRLQAAKAAEKLAAAAETTSKAGQDDEQGEAEEAAKQSELAQEQLEEAQQQLEERRKQAENELAGEQLAKIEDALKGLLTRQQGVIDETLRLEQIRSKAGGQFTRAQSQSVQSLAREQAAVAEDTKLLAEKIASAEVFHLQLNSAADDMQRATALLFQRETGTPTQNAERAALLRFTQIQEAMKKDDKKAGDEGKPSKPGDGEKKNQESRDGIQHLAQLKLLRLMQQDLQTRTKTAETGHPDPEKLTEDDLRHFQSLRREQGELADLLKKLTQPKRQAAPEDDPEKLPDVRKSGPPDRRINGEADKAERQESP